MPEYLLTCQCGNRVPVEIGQAGERVACQCGAMLDVPPLRKLRHFPLAEGSAVHERPTRRTWNFRYGIIAAFLILASGLAFWAVWSRLSEPQVEPFDADVRERLIDESLERMTPVQGWQVWIERYRPLSEHGFIELQHPHTAAIEQLVAERRFLQKVLLAVAAAFALVAVIVAVWPQAPTGRQGDKETRRRS